MQNQKEGRVTKTTAKEIVCDLAYLESIGSSQLVDISEVVFHENEDSEAGLCRLFAHLKELSANQSLRLILLRS